MTMGEVLVMLVNPLPKDKILDWSRFKAFADNKINDNKKLQFALGRLKNCVGKGENAGYQQLLLFSAMFQKGFFPRVVKSQNCVVQG